MKQVLVLFALLSLAFATPDRRIVGGTNALPGELPYQASLRFWGTDFHFAGAAIITNRWVVTVGNYLVGRAQDSINIVVGITNLNSVVANQRSDRIIVHADFNRNANLNNIGLVRSSVIIPFTIFTASIPLGPTLIGTDVSAIASGWGATSQNKGPDSNFLQRRDVSTVPCLDTPFFSPSPQHICAQAAQCTTDLGGPLAAGNALIGISSWHNPDVCGALGGQDYYVRISFFRNWIMGNID